MNISYADLPGYTSGWSSGLEWIHAIKTWSEAYEEKYMVPDMNNKVTADETTKMLLYNFPPALHSFGYKVVSTLMDDRLRNAMMYVKAPPTLQTFVESVFVVRKYLLRWAFLPRPWAFRVAKVMESPDAQGRLFKLDYQSEPW